MRVLQASGQWQSQNEILSEPLHWLGLEVSFLCFVFIFFFFLFSFPARPDLNQRRVNVFSADEAAKCIASRQFKTPILSLAFSCKGHLAVCLADRIFWFKFAEKGESVKQVSTCQNPDGVFAISDDGHLLAYPVGPNVICVRHGNEELGRVTTDSPFCKLRFNPKGAGQDLLAAVSEGGKTVWIWSLQRNEQKMTLKYEFTRSRASQCRVEGLDFNSLSTLLSLSTDSGTVHVFELIDANQQSKGGYFGSMTSWIPSVVAPSVTSKFKVRVKPRSHALACLMVGEMLMPSEVDGGEGQPRRSVFVLTSTGNLQEYSLPEATAGGSSVLETDLPLRNMRVFV